MTLVERIEKSEGFEGLPYDDTLGNPTIGYGTLLPITRFEAELLLQHRLYKVIEELDRAKDINRLNSDRKDVLYEMAYQMGVPTLLRFVNMWRAIEANNYSIAAREMLDSRWAKQTPDRAKRLAERMQDDD